MNSEMQCQVLEIGAVTPSRPDMLQYGVSVVMREGAGQRCEKAVTHQVVDVMVKNIVQQRDLRSRGPFRSGSGAVPATWNTPDQ